MDLGRFMSQMLKFPGPCMFFSHQLLIFTSCEQSRGVGISEGASQEPAMQETMPAAPKCPCTHPLILDEKAKAREGRTLFTQRDVVL